MDWTADRPDMRDRIFAPAGDVSARQRDQAAGLVVARRMCSECHAVERKTTPFLNPDAPSFNWIANQPGMTANFLSVETRRRHQKPMPIINLNADELRDIVAYILSFKRAK
jgi:mono/diheme cytochrome c family protein